MLKTIKYIKANVIGNRTLVYALAIVLFFVLACWGIWVFFDYKISDIKQEQFNAH